MEPEPPTFEECFGRLQQAIERLEQGGLPLEAALELFDESMSLAASCRQILDSAELRLTRLVEQHASALEGVNEE
jgi:exodeoxyribonuclease VII small subunit